MNREIGRALPDQPANARVLHNHRVHTGGNHGPEMFSGIGQFVLEDQRVEGDITAHAAPVKKVHQFGQVGRSEVVRPHPGVEFFEAEINRIGAILDRGAGAIPVAGRREQLGQLRSAQGGVRKARRRGPGWVGTLIFRSRI